MHIHPWILFPLMISFRAKVWPHTDCRGECTLNTVGHPPHLDRIVVFQLNQFHVEKFEIVQPRAFIINKKLILWSILWQITKFFWEFNWQLYCHWKLGRRKKSSLWDITGTTLRPSSSSYIVFSHSRWTKPVGLVK